MGYMKELDIRIYGGGEDAIAAACELAGIVEERRAYDAVNSATSDITDIVTVLRGVGFAAIPPSAGESASLLLYCVTHAADEIERLRAEQQWIPVSERWPDDGVDVLVSYGAGEDAELLIAHWRTDERGWFDDEGLRVPPERICHWLPMPNPPEVT